MKNRKLKIGILLTAILIGTFGAYAIWANVGPKNTPLAEAKQEFSLVQPAFAQSMTAATTFLNQEAGMAIWLNATANASLNLNQAKNAMVNVESNTSDYVVGSISLQSAGFSSDDWPHCFVSQNGWIVVYYLKGAPMGKMMILYSPWYDNNQLKDNLLHNALAYISSALGISDMTIAQYYHFQHPSATTLELAIKTADHNTETFNIKVPSSFTIDEYSWSYYSAYSGSFSIDSTSIASGGGRQYGGSQITPALLVPDIWHTVTMSAANVYGTSYTTVCILMLYH